MNSTTSISRSEAIRGFEITHAIEAKQKEEVYRFRYRVYYEQMGRDKDLADHKNKTLSDPLDKNAIIVAAYYKGRVVGSCRMNFSDTDILPENDLYKYASFKNPKPGDHCLITKLVIDPIARRTLLFFDLAKEIYLTNLLRKSKYGFLACNDEMVPLFEKVGFRRHAPRHDQWKDYGTSNPMIFEVQNLQHLRNVRSPLIRSYPDYELRRELLEAGLGLTGTNSSKLAARSG